jgi:hypothetical protein
MSHHVFGIRHHGPGCARSLVQALERLEPDLLLVEGPPDADEVLRLAASPEMRTPVAILVYPPEHPHRAVFYPFAEFSPEWQAIRFGLARGVPVRFMDLPQAHRLAKPEAAEPEGSDEPEEHDEPPADRARLDPIEALGNAAGFSDGELWWEHEIERRKDPAGLFEGLLEAMRALRESRTAPGDDEEEEREAFMRQTIRGAIKAGAQKIAVVCGAWHAPVLATLGPAKPDADRLKVLPKIKTVATWIPWTPGRLAFRSGYGAGVNAPGWYQHLWTTPHEPTLRWTVRAARTLRDEDLPSSTASVIEAVRLAETLAALRGLGSPGLGEITESVQAVLCGGAAGPLALVRDRLEIGTGLGQVPKEAPAVPLRRELEGEEKRLRLKRTDEIKLVDLDLREQNDRARSRLLHRLQLLGVAWGTPRVVSGKSGTFHELWDLRWQPELEVALVEASRWGNTIEDAASGCASSRAATLEDLAALSELLDQAVVAELGATIATVLARLQERAALSADVVTLAGALPRLAHLARYGSARGAAPEPILSIFDGLFERVVIGLPGASCALDDEAAERLAEAIGKVQESVGLLDRAEAKAAWLDALAVVAARETAAPLVRGLAARVLHEQRRLDLDGLLTLASRNLSRAVPPADAAAWIEGLLRGSAALLLHARELWSALDAWLAALDFSAFEEMLPALRRAFANFEPPERRSMGALVRGLGGAGPVRATASRDAELDPDRADKVMPVLAHILGVTTP